jgi:hypothetical protein
VSIERQSTASLQQRTADAAQSTIPFTPANLLAASLTVKRISLKHSQNAVDVVDA